MMRDPYEEDRARQAGYEAPSIRPESGRNPGGTPKQTVQCEGCAQSMVRPTDPTVVLCRACAEELQLDSGRIPRGRFPVPDLLEHVTYLEGLVRSIRVSVQNATDWFDIGNVQGEEGTDLFNDLACDKHGTATEELLRWPR